MESSTADPLLHICPVLVGSSSEQFRWERDMQVFFCLFPHTNRCMKLSRAKRQTDGGVRCMKEKDVLFGPECLTEWAVLHFYGKTARPLCFAVTVEPGHLKPLGTQGGKTFSRYITFCMIEIHKLTSWKYTSTCMFLFNRSSNLNDRIGCRHLFNGRLLLTQRMMTAMRLYNRSPLARS